MLQLDHLLNLWIDMVECGNAFVYEMNGGARMILSNLLRVKVCMIIIIGQDIMSINLCGAQSDRKRKWVKTFVLNIT